jgi:hypothetical protein
VYNHEEYQKRYRKEHREELLLKKKQFRKDHHDKIMSDKKIYYRDNKRTVLKNGRLKTSFGITIEQYYEVAEKQKHCCAICGIHQSKLVRFLAVDHDHKTNRNRGLLCMKCNIAIGMLNDSTKLLDKAKKYLENYK